jgi:hypothetical protein
MFRLLVLIAVSAMLLRTCEGFERFPKHNTKGAGGAKKAVKLDVTGCPDLKSILEEVDMGEHLMKFARMGITETRLLLRMNEMDFTMLTLDHPDITEEQVGKVRAVAKKYFDIAAAASEAEIEKEEVVDPERSRQKFGRVIIPGAVQYFEYVQASFGSSAPLGALDVEVAPFPNTGCSQAFYRKLHRDLEVKSEADAGVEGDAEVEEPEEKGPDLTGKVFVVKRGHCTFLQKAQYALERNASALLVVNNVDKLERAASGYGLDPTVKNADVLKVEKLPIFGVSNTSWAKIAFSAERGYQWVRQSDKDGSNLHAGSSQTDLSEAKNENLDSLKLRFVPLKCGEKLPGMKHGCQPLLERERKLHPEVSWGSMRITSGGSEEGRGKVTKSFQFLTSSFGGVLPVDALTLIESTPADGCKPFANSEAIASTNANVVVAIDRGNCMFQDKLYHAEQAGARLGLVLEASDEQALQRIGGNAATSSHIGMPSIICSWPCREYVKGVLAEGGSATIQLRPAQDHSLTEKWIDLVTYEWSEEDEQKARQMEQMVPQYSGDDDIEIRAWLRRQAGALRGEPVGVATDGF